MQQYVMRGPGVGRGGGGGVCLDLHNNNVMRGPVGGGGGGYTICYVGGGGGSMHSYKPMYIARLQYAMCHVWGRKCSLFPEHLISLPFGSS